MQKMPIKEPNNYNYVLILMTFFGAIAGYAYKVLRGDVFSWRVLMLQVIVSMFAGFLMILIAHYCKWDVEIAGCIAGLAGWSGAELIKALESRLIKKVGDHDAN